MCIQNNKLTCKHLDAVLIHLGSKNVSESILKQIWNNFQNAPQSDWESKIWPAHIYRQAV